jgi:ribose transport system substrate-binding protein
MKLRTPAIAVAGLTLVLPLAACSSSKPSGSAAPNNTAAANPSAPAASAMVAPPKASKNYNIQFIQGVTGDQFYITMQCGVQAEAAKLGVTVKTQGPQKFDPTLQKPILDSVVATKPDAILIAPTDVKAMQAPLAAAAAAGTKIVLVDTTTQDPSYAVSAIASDNEGGGKAAFEAIKQLAPQGGKVLAISVDPGISTTDARVKGFSDAAAADGHYPYVGVQYSHNDPATAAQLVTAALQKDPDIVGVFAANLFAAQGSATGIQQAGKKGKVNVIGFDAGPDQVKALQAGTVQALIAQQPAYIGTVGLGEAVAALDGGQITKSVQTGFSIITQQNLTGDQKDAVYKASC